MQKGRDTHRPPRVGGITRTTPPRAPSPAPQRPRRARQCVAPGRPTGPCRRRWRPSGPCATSGPTSPPSGRPWGPRRARSRRAPVVRVRWRRGSCQTGLDCARERAPRAPRQRTLRTLTALAGPAAPRPLRRCPAKLWGAREGERGEKRGVSRRSGCKQAIKRPRARAHRPGESGTRTWCSRSAASCAALGNRRTRRRIEEESCGLRGKVASLCVLRAIERWRVAAEGRDPFKGAARERARARAHPRARASNAAQKPPTLPAWRLPRASLQLNARDRIARRF